MNSADSSSEEGKSTWKWLEYKIETLIAIRKEMKANFQDVLKKQGLCVVILYVISYSLVYIIFF